MLTKYDDHLNSEVLAKRGTQIGMKLQKNNQKMRSYQKIRFGQLQKVCRLIRGMEQSHDRS